MITRPHRHALMALTAAMTAAFLLTGCTSSAQPQPAPSVDATSVMSHVHAISIDQQDRILVATHDGVYRLPEIAGSGELSGPLGGARFDAMSFITVGDTMFASGHPGPESPASFGTPNVGLLTATGAADTWDGASLVGETDFHTLTATRIDTNIRIYGVDAGTGQLLRSDDSGNTWTTGAKIDAGDIAAYPGKAETLYATTRTGIAISTDGGDSFKLDTKAPILTRIGVTTNGTLYGLSPDNFLWQQTSGTWTRGEITPGAPQALTLSRENVIVATDRGIFTTSDLGHVWTTVWGNPSQPLG